MSSLNQSCCYLCKRIFQSAIKYDVHSTLSDATLTPLSQLIEASLKLKIFLEDQIAFLCAECLRTINALDTHQAKAAEIKEVIEKYLDKSTVQRSLNVYSQTDEIPTATVDDMQYEEEEEVFGCKKCGAALKTNEELKEHLKTHVIQMYECGECKQTFLSKNGYVIHQKKKHGVQGEVEEDKIKEYKTQGSSNSGPKSFVCEKCGQTYKNKSALDIHVGMHNGVYPFTCEYCNKSFTQKAALQRHTPIHTGVAPYQCDVCGRTFLHHSSFSIHRLSHTGEKSYKCGVCGKGLFSTSHLKRHMRVHTGEKNYLCLKCGKRFAEKYNLMSHQRLHEGTEKRAVKRKFRCQICGMACSGKTRLDEHMMIEHSSFTEVKGIEDELRSSIDAL